MKLKSPVPFHNPLRRLTRPMPMTLRLPLTYAAIALLVTLSMGLVLLTTLQRYYAAREIDYLRNNAVNISNVVGLLMENDTAPEEIQAQVEFFSFLSRTRIEILNTTGQLVADANITELTGQPRSEQQGARGVFVTGAPDKGDVLSYFFMASTEADSAFPPPPFMLPAENMTPERVQIITRDNDTVEVRREETAWAASVPALPVEMGAEIYLENPDNPFSLEDVTVQIVPSLYGFGIRDRVRLDEVSRTSRSHQLVTQTIQAPDGSNLGSIRLSNGPAYGVEIVESVAQGWLIASAVSVTLAVIVGWLISKSLVNPLLELSHATTRMEHGDLSARATVLRQDEFGQVAQSFNRMAQRIEETINTLQRFVSDAAHELNTPITALRTNLELIERDASEPDVINRALSQIKRLEDLTQNLLRLSRLESQTEAIEILPVDVVAVTHEVAQFHASQAEQAGITLQLDLPEQPLFADAHDSQLQHALSNLVHNAIKFTPSGGTVSISVQGETNYIFINVEDTGIGIPDDDMPYLFNRFHRARNASRYAGSGLGLAIVKAIITRFGGLVTAQKTDNGTRFTVQLPLQAGATNHAKHY
jgi:signal transduction histidine kinase